MIANVTYFEIPIPYQMLDENGFRLDVKPVQCTVSNKSRIPSQLEHIYFKVNSTTFG